MGHRKEVFKPRKGKKRIAPQVNKALEENNFEKAIQSTLSHYINKKSADTFSTSLLATTEAFNIANAQGWTRSIEEVTYRAIKNTEADKEISLTRFQRETVHNIRARAH